jgi:hypothetical protein
MEQSAKFAWTHRAGAREQFAQADATAVSFPRPEGGNAYGTARIVPASRAFAPMLLPGGMIRTAFLPIAYRPARLQWRDAYGIVPYVRIRDSLH